MQSEGRPPLDLPPMMSEVLSTANAAVELHNSCADNVMESLCREAGMTRVPQQARSYYRIAPVSSLHDVLQRGDEVATLSAIIQAGEQLVDAMRKRRLASESTAAWNVHLLLNNARLTSENERLVKECEHLANRNKEDALALKEGTRARRRLDEDRESVEDEDEACEWTPF